ncbi:OCLN protein, partial [Tricholaema leucomelas]|nr:OCLN protein [Tricholaema leucomelas]
MFSKKSYDSPPTGYGPPTTGYGYDYGARSPPPGSYYIEDAPQHFYKWTSPPGVVRILQAVVILLCIAIFACVASTLAWEYGYGYGGIYGSGLGGYYGSGYYGGALGYGSTYGGYYGGVTNPRAANGFMMAMAVLCFLSQLGLFVGSVTKSRSSRSRRFYLVVLVGSAILAFVMLIAAIVYVVGVNPQAQMSGSYYYNPLLAMCNQIYTSGFTNQYLYHYCTVDPQEAVAIVCGFLIVILLCLICFFAHQTRSKIWKYGKPNIYWDKMPVAQEGPNVEEWVKNVADGASLQDETATLAYSEKPTSPITAPPYSPPSYSYPPQNGYYPSGTYSSRGDQAEQAASPSPAEEKPREQPSRAPARRGRRRRRNPELDESQYETDYTTAVESGDERDQHQWA